MKKIVLISLISLVLAGLGWAESESFWISGYRYYPLSLVCQQKDIEYSWDPLGRIVTLEKNGIEGRIRVGSDKILINGQKLEDIGPPLFLYNEILVMPSSFANRSIDRIFKYTPKPIAYKKKDKKIAAIHTIKKIVLDPGHGGKDPGAIGRDYGLKEKNIVLDIAKRLKKLLSDYGITVYLTRDKDLFVPLHKRTELANRINADFFISIHVNAFRSKSAKGFEVYYLSEATDDNAKALEAVENATVRFEEGLLDRYNRNTKAIAYDLKFTENRIESKELAKHLINGVRDNTYIRDRAIKGARFNVLKNIAMPGLLVEVGFISNKKEEYKLSLSSYREEIAEGLTKGILAYKEIYERTNGFSR